jgi:hypothetical protein
VFGESLVMEETPKNPEKPTASDEKEIHLNARGKNCLYESFSIDIFNQVFILTKANEIWLKLHEIQDNRDLYSLKMKFG